MGYIAIILRLSIVGIGVYMIITSPTVFTPPFNSGVAFILIALYLGIQSIFGYDSVSCPIAKICKNRKSK